MSERSKRIRKLAEPPPDAKALADLKTRVKRLENRVADLGAYAQAVKEMRARECCEEESLLGTSCLKCGAPVIFDFYCEEHLPPKIRAIWEEAGVAIRRVRRE